MSDCRFGVSPVNYPDPDPKRSTNRLNSGNFKILIALQNDLTETASPAFLVFKKPKPHTRKDGWGNLHLIN